jgi:SAM-dependent methyltransferase
MSGRRKKGTAVRGGRKEGGKKSRGSQKTLDPRYALPADSVAQTVFMTFYGDDLAYIHHRGFTQALRNAAPHLLDILRQRGILSGRVVDLGCGSGVWARALTGAGYDVTGVDASLAMLRIARREAPKASFKHTSLFRAAIPPCAAVTALGECLNYDTGKDGASTRQRFVEELLRRIFRQVSPSGLFIFDVHAWTTAPAMRRRKVLRAGKDWLISHEARINGLGTRLMRTITVSRRVGMISRQGTEVHVLHLYDPLRLAAMMERTGFQVQIVDRYGDVPLLPGRVGFVAQKPA